MEMRRLTRDGATEPVSRDQILRRKWGQGKCIFPVQLTTSRIGNLTRLILTLAVCGDHTYIHTWVFWFKLHNKRAERISKVDFFNIIQKYKTSLFTIQLKGLVDEEQWRIARGIITSLELSTFSFDFFLSSRPRTVAD